MSRPLVLVYQEYAAISATPTSPDLNCLIAGPAYWIKDYLDDKGDIQADSDYGTKNSNNPYTPPALYTDAVTISEPPGNKTGAILDANSVNVYFDECRVLIAEDSDDSDVSTGADVTSGSNLVTATGGTPIDFVATGIQAGDYLIIEDPAGGGTDIVKRVLAVDSTTVLRTTTNFTATATDLIFRIEREVNDVLIDSSFLTITLNEIIVGGGVTTILTGESTARTVTYAKVYVEYKSLRQDLRSVDTVSSETDITTKIGKIDARNPLAGVLATALKNTTTLVQFFGVKSDDSTGHTECIELIEGRDDIYAIVPLTEDKNIIAQYNTNNETLASVSNAENTGVPQKFRVVIGAQALPTEKVVSGPYTDGSHKCVKGSIPGTTIASADDAIVFVDASATFVTDAVRAGDKLVIVSDTATDSRKGEYTIAEVYDEKRLRVQTTTAFPDPTTPNDLSKLTGNAQYYIIRGTGTPVSSTTFTGGDSVAAGPNVTMPSITGTSAMVGNVLVLTAPVANVGNWLITALNAAGPPGDVDVAHHSLTLADDTGSTAGSQVSTIASVTTARAVTTRRPFRIISDAAATFNTDAVKATDTLQVPNPITGTNYTLNYEYIVAFIPNENDVVLDTYTDVVASDPIDGDTDLNYRINRDLSKNDMVTELITISQSFNSRRTILVWPDEVTVNGLVDGSKTRAVSTVAEAADTQPGYYLGGIVGAMTSGLPSHQGFTNLGITGIDEITHSTRYFSDTQITDISNAGWFVFIQDSPNALPKCIHQLTTDPDTLETGEYSLVKNFDYLALFFVGILKEFRGVYNVTNETIGFLKQDINDGIDALKLRKYAKIGAPLINASITSLAASTSAADRVEAYLTINMPKPLNTLGLHLVAG
ncbi:MAG: hypothetical protein PVI90_00150 [Desulfobacteraceae bacterium]|jgi:hypothetical protein